MAEFDHWRTFVRVVECGSFSQAACHLRVARSAVSRRVSELESDLGVTLLMRTTRCVKTTEIGQMTYRRATKLLAEFDELECEAAGKSANLAGPIRVTAPSSFALDHVQSIFQSFQLENPGVCLDLRFSDRRDDIIGDGFDFAIRIGAEIDGSMVAKRLCTINQLVVASPKYLERNGTPQAPEDLATHRSLCYPSSTQADTWRYWRDGEVEGHVHVSPAMICDTGEVLLNAALAGTGVLCGPTCLTAAAVSNGSLIPILTDWRWSNMAAYLVFPPNRRIPRRVRALMESIAGSLPDPTPWDAEIAEHISHANRCETAEGGRSVPKQNARRPPHQLLDGQAFFQDECS